MLSVVVCVCLCMCACVYVCLFVCEGCTTVSMNFKILLLDGVHNFVNVNIFISKIKCLLCLIKHSLGTVVRDNVLAYS